MNNRLFHLLLTLLTAIILLISCMLSSTAAVWMAGDADGDGTVTSIDVTTAQRVIAGILHDDDGSISRRADVTGDGLSLPDVTAIQRYLAGLTDRYHIGETVGNDPPLLPTEDNQLPVVR